ncbi:MAG: hypothetical protein ACOYT7_02295 [Patescibacteria group bacterium]
MELDRQQRLEETFLNNLSFHTKEFYNAQSQEASAYVLRTLDTEIKNAYELCLRFGIPHVRIAMRFVEDAPLERRNFLIKVYRKKLAPHEFRELAGYFGIRR